ncbi:MAG: hypothetical protein UZ05_CHB002002990 [Chlorobi bacterium OLB5]|nr:MAG: hypothetical protein UZ05_CHB002002990 [Chlorobi bacterium OLB5]
MQIVNEYISILTLQKMAEQGFGDMVKAVVDVEKKIMAVDADLHADEEAVLLEHGSVQNDLWGINIYPFEKGENFIEYDSMINIRPRQNNRSRIVEDPETRQLISQIILNLVK